MYGPRVDIQAKSHLMEDSDLVVCCLTPLLPFSLLEASSHRSHRLLGSEGVGKCQGLQEIICACSTTFV